MKHFRYLLLIIQSIFLFSSDIWSGSTGKIAGTIKDKTSAEVLANVKIILESFSLNVLSDSLGQYTLLAVPPGIHTIQIISSGYRALTINRVKVSIDQTTWLDAELTPQTDEDGIVVSFNERIKIPEAANSRVYISSGEIEQLPVNNVISVIGLQSGIKGGWNSNYNNFINLGYNDLFTSGKVAVQGDLKIRGNEGDEILFMADGILLRDPRNNEPVMKLPLSIVEDIEIERNGMNAEYGQVQSGIIHIVTKEGQKHGYNGTFQVRYNPSSPKYWKGPGVLDINDPYSFALRPFFDPDVCWTGTLNGKWDRYTRRQYPDFQGWNLYSEVFLHDDDPNNDFSPAALQRIFMYETRKKMYLNKPDYDIDAGFGGPFPVVGSSLGNLRFYAAFRSTREMLLVPLTRPDYTDYDWTLQLNSDISSSMRLRLFGSFGRQYTVRNNFDPLGSCTYLYKPDEIAGAVSIINNVYDFLPLFSDFYFSQAEIGYYASAAKLIHTITPQTFYEISLEYFQRAYDVHPISLRDTSIKFEVLSGFFEDSNPFGYWPYESKGLFLGTRWDAAIPFDYTSVNSIKLKADLSHQLNFQNLLKAGIELAFNDLNFNYGNRETMLSTENRMQMNGAPIYGGLYIQNKFEIKDFSISGGIRLDFNDLNTDWYDIDLDNWREVYLLRWNDPNQIFPKRSSTTKWQVSPRLSAAWEFFDNAKLFINYGHFHQTPQYVNLYRGNRDIINIGDPNLQFVKTVSYELGFNCIFFNDFMFQSSAFYNTESNDPYFTSYISTSSGISYTQLSSDYYQNRQGVELTLRKFLGPWLTGFINYTYQADEIGFKGNSRNYSYQVEQIIWERSLRREYTPAAAPYARANISINTPFDFGPSISGYNILGDFGLNVTADWQAGYKATYNPYYIPDISNNISSVDYFNIALRFEKTLRFGQFNLKFFMDIDNVLNTLRLWNNYTGSHDDLYYLSSLHLPKSNAYSNIPGNDKLGDYRKPGVEFQPMEHVSVLDPNGGFESAWYYEDASGKYFEWKNDQWIEVGQNRLNKALEDKAYIDMPNASTFWFLNPRKIYFGLKVSFAFD